MSALLHEPAHLVLGEWATSQNVARQAESRRDVRVLVRRIDALRTKLSTVYSKAFVGSGPPRGNAIGDRLIAFVRR